MNLEQFEDVNQKPRAKSTLIIFFVLLIVLAGVYAFVLVSNAKKTEEKARVLIGEAAIAEQLKTAIKDESSRCESFIAGEEGEFGEFEYCKRFLKWGSEFSE